MIWKYNQFKKYIVLVLAGILIVQGLDLIFIGNTYFFELLFWFFWIVFFFDVGVFVGTSFVKS